ncbi:strawberry notch-like NTP hydrolase domain-containing protein [Sphingobium sp. YR768]|uniref:strawberry notch-like NTP hydrolase domain-containing protein n=1 Tax=Sphingobium sp. YR768 TaxID=1884365 RepID=UPI0008B2EF05|nr:strawberry notch family protein [Sphingobium sp. YR768]SER15020.1 C-terminal domain on Strawberry notch homologue [Sphingobium sp. YR768]
MNLPQLALSQTQDAPARLFEVARSLVHRLRNGGMVNRQSLKRVMTQMFGEDDAAGAWSMRDAYDALETAQVLHLTDPQSALLAGTPLDIFQRLRQFERGLPTQTYRSEKQVDLQQFSTPISLAWLAAMAARCRSDDILLEPSAGTGMLAVHGSRAGACLLLNERDPARAALLSRSFGQIVTGHDAEHIQDLLITERPPTLVLINPPFSRSAGRGIDRHAGARHLRGALASLAPGGRCVAIMPTSFSPEGSAALGYNAVAELVPPRVEITILGRPYAKHGTGIDVRLLVFDKGWVGMPERHIAANIEAALELALAIPDRLDPLQPPPLVPPPAVALSPSRPATNISPGNLFAHMNGQRLAPPSRIAAAANDARLIAYTVRREPFPPGEIVGIYSAWRPARIAIDGVSRHPDDLVESIAMASVSLPVPRYQPLLQDRAVTALSEAQLETVIYAGEAHARDLVGSFSSNIAGDRLIEDKEGKLYRTGFFIADGTGVGKGREAAGIILDQWNRANRRAIWISMADLIEDARRDWTALGGLAIDIQPISNFPLGTSIIMESGIVFLTYAALRSARHDTASRLQQLLDWTGEGFAGVIVFDESHAMAHAGGTETDFGKARGSEQGLAGVRLQNALPRARILYMSATGAARPENLSYAVRLGLWGPGTAFATRDMFMTAMEEGGIAALEVVCRDLKAMGLYTARALSFAGVEYEPLEHVLTPDQISIYDAYADSWSIIHRGLRDVLAEIGIVDRISGKTQNARARGSALSAFESAKLRFFSSLLVSMKIPSLVEAIEQELSAGNAVLVQLASTGESIMDRRLSELSAEERATMDVQVSPKETLIDYLKNAFPVRQMRVFRAEDGAMRAEPMIDADGNPVLCRQATTARDELIEELCALPAIPTALDALIAHFGTDRVAEITGRSRRIVTEIAGRQKVERRGARANVFEVQAFQDGRKPIAAFSLAGSTGRSMHSDRDCSSAHRRRIHFLLELGFRIFSAVQGFGRSHRTNQLTPPVYRPLTTDCRGERRFLSTIIRGLEALGALTRGQRQTGSQNLFDPSDNLESDHARDALIQWFHLLYEGKLRSVSLADFQDMTGLELCDEGGELLERLPPIHRWLNRILALRIATQNSIFEEFLGLVEDRVEVARAAGTLDLGIETIRAEKMDLLSDRLLRTDPVTGAETRLLRLELHRRPPVTSWAELLLQCKGIGDIACLHNARSGRVALRVPTWRGQDEEGEWIERCYLIRPTGQIRIDVAALSGSHWSEIERDTFQALWEQEAAEAGKNLMVETITMATGLLLPVWHKLPEDDVRVWRIDDGVGSSILGRIIHPAAVERIEREFGLDGGIALGPDEIIAGARTASGVSIPGLGPARLARVHVNDSPRLEIRDYRPEDRTWLKACGAFSEVVAFKTRLFLPPDRASDILARLIAERA